MTQRGEASSTYAQRADADPAVTAILEAIDLSGVDAWPLVDLVPAFVASVRAIRDRTVARQFSADAVKDVRWALTFGMEDVLYAD